LMLQSFAGGVVCVFSIFSLMMVLLAGRVVRWAAAFV
jgi:hypothetical protein